MIRTQTFLKVVDNSGAKLVKCIKVKKKGGNSYAGVGDIVLVAVQSLRPRYGRRIKSKIKKSEVYHAVVVQTCRLFRNKAGFGQNFEANSVALINPQLKPLGSRISAVLPSRLRGLKWAKLASMGRKII